MFILRDTDAIRTVTKADRIIYYIGYAGLLIASFAWGWNKHVFTKDE